MREVDVLDGRGAHAGDLVGHERHANAGATDENAPIGRAVGHGARHGVCIVGIVDTRGVGGPKVLDRVAEALKVGNDGGLLVEAAVIGTNGDTHATTP